MLNELDVRFSTNGPECTLCVKTYCKMKNCRESCDGAGGNHCLWCNDWQDETHLAPCDACIIIDCKGSECGMTHDDGKFIHCETCGGPHDSTDWILPPSIDPLSLKLIDCKEARCGIHHGGRGNGILHCTSCFPKIKG